MIVAGLDLSLRNSGVALVGPTTICLGQATFVRAPKSPTEKLERKIAMASTVMKYLVAGNPDVVVIEDYAYAGITRILVDLAEMNGMLKRDLWTVLNVIPEYLTVTEVQKTLTGSGKAGKPAIRRFFKDRGIRTQSLDVSDALAVAVGYKMKQGDSEIVQRLSGMRVEYV